MPTEGSENLWKVLVIYKSMCKCVCVRVWPGKAWGGSNLLCLADLVAVHQQEVKAKAE